MLGKKALAQALSPPRDESALKGHLFRNDLEIHPDGTRTLRFTDVTVASGIDARGYGMGVATGDFNNDGCVDLYVTNLGRNQLYRSNCNGTFTDVSKQSGTDDDGWSVSAAFVDYDRDGWLDLFVGHYVNYSTDANIKCFSLTGGSDYCSPNVYRAQPSRLYHNNRDGTFTDVTRAAGMAAEFGPTLGVVTADFNGDGWIDIYVANDGQANQLWINQRNGTFKNMGLLSGSALNADGKTEASMGVDAGDFDDDGDEDLVVTNLTDEGSALYVNNGLGMFEDKRIGSGLRSFSLAYTGFGTAWFDFDNDGRLDILSVNGAVRVVAALEQAHDPFPLHQRNLLFRNIGDGRFEVLDLKGHLGGLGDMDKAEAHLRQRTPGEIRPPDPLMQELESVLESPVAYEVRGAKALDERDWKRAAIQFRKGIELAPAEPSLHHKLGTALYLDGDVPGAAAEFAEALRMAPHFAKAHYSLGVIVASSGGYADAIKRFSAAVRSEPDYVEARLALADTLRGTGRSEEALRHYESLLTFDPRVAEARLGYAMTLVGLKRYQQAYESLLESARLHPDRLEFAQALTRLLAAAPDDRIRDGRRAMELTQQLLKGPRSIELSETMAMTLAELGQYQEAVAWQHEAIAAAARTGHSDVAQCMAENLKLYEAHKPCRTPWRDGELP